MSQFDLVLIGALGVVVLYFLVRGFIKAWKIVSSIERALNAIPKVQKSLDDLVILLKAVITGGNPNFPNFGLDTEGNPLGPQPLDPMPRAPFPSPVFDRFTVKPDEPDAVPEDTIVISSTDEELIDAERVENLRRMGFQVEEPETQHKAIEVDSE
jgi:hypothetical protein